MSHLTPDRESDRDEAPDEAPDMLDDLLIEKYVLLTGLLTCLVLILLAMMGFAMTGHPKLPPGFVTVSVLPVRSSPAPLLIGDDIGVLVRNDASGQTVFSDGSPDPTDMPQVKFCSLPQRNYSIGIGGTTDPLSVGFWLRQASPSKLADPQYLHALRVGIRLAIYPTHRAYEVQSAIRDGSFRSDMASVVELNAAGGFSAVTEIEAQLFKGE